MHLLHIDCIKCTSSHRAKEYMLHDASHSYISCPYCLHLSKIFPNRLSSSLKKKPIDGHCLWMQNKASQEGTLQFCLSLQRNKRSSPNMQWLIFEGPAFLRGSLTAACKSPHGQMPFILLCGQFRFHDRPRPATASHREEANKTLRL